MSTAQSRIGSFCVSLLVGLIACGAAQAKLAGTPHDLGGGICDKCHTPRGTTPLASPQWSQNEPVKARFALYDSPATPSPTGGRPHGVSLVCLACHDGVTSYNALLKNPAPQRVVSGNPAMHSLYGLSDRHPVSITYDRALGGDYNRAAAGHVGRLPLFGSLEAGGVRKELECASCHNPHDMRYGRYLRVDNSRSALCLTCHIK